MLPLTSYTGSTAIMNEPETSPRVTTESITTIAPAHRADVVDLATSARNWVLRALPTTDREILAAKLERVTLRTGDTVGKRGAMVEYLIFPERAVVSLLVPPPDGGKPLEVAAIGCEGIVGVTSLMSGAPAFEDAVVCAAGDATRIPVAAFSAAVAEMPALRLVAERYIGALTAQLAQRAVCDRTHSIEQRLARTLLLMQDRTGAETLALTHEQLGAILGVRRAGVTEAASLLQSRALIRYRRGKVTIADRAALERTSCGCYRALSDTFTRIGTPTGPVVA